MKHIATTCFIAIVTFAFVGCDQKKNETPAPPAAPKTESAADKVIEKAPEPVKAIPVSKLPQPPKFKSDNANAFMKDYVAFCDEYVGSAKDANKAQELHAKALEFAIKQQQIMQEISSDTEERQKFADYMAKLSEAQMGTK